MSGLINSDEVKSNKELVNRLKEMIVSDGVDTDVVDTDGTKAKAERNREQKKKRAKANRKKKVKESAQEESKEEEKTVNKSVKKRVRRKKKNQMDEVVEKENTKIDKDVGKDAKKDEGEEKTPPPSLEQTRAKPKRNRNRNKAKQGEKQGETTTDKTKAKTNNRRTRKVFDFFISKSQIEQGLESGLYLLGSLRVNAKNQRQSYVTVEGLDRDVLVEGKKHRNRASHNDQVILEIVGEQKEKNEAKSEEGPRKLGKVVAISERSSSSPFLPGNSVVGYLQGFPSKFQKHHKRGKDGRKQQDEVIDKSIPANAKWAMFIPHDPREPIGDFEIAQLPQEMQSSPELMQKLLLVVSYETWNEHQHAPRVKLVKTLGSAGQLDIDLAALLLRFEVTHTDQFSEEVLGDLHKFQAQFQQAEDGSQLWKVPADELARRTDLREKCIFSIDPPTARDLDDALSVEQLASGDFEVGVHIADVSYFVEEGSLLDLEARNRATSVYLVDKVIPMLPRMLCENLCSLNPREDRLSFSVFWTMTKDAEIDYSSARFCKSIIRSCAKLSYGNVQDILDCPEKAPEILPKDIKWTPAEIAGKCKMLHALAMARRNFRYSSGSLALDSVSLKFETDAQGLPTSVIEYERTESHFLVEEFMLLANEMAARKISASHPDRGLLRRHPPPDSLDRLQQVCDEFNVHSELSSSLSIHKAIQGLRSVKRGETSLGEVIEHLFVRQMRPAEYFCIQGESFESWHHFNLNLDYYTHFTSPIRRYADLVVHRLLAQDLDFETCLLSTQQITDISKNCNTRNTNCRYLETEMSVLYFCHLIKRFPRIGNKAVLVDMGQTSFRLFLVAFGIEEQVSCADLISKSGAIGCRIEGEDFSLQKKLIIQWSEELTIEYSLFETLHVHIAQRESMRAKIQLKVLSPAQDTNTKNI